MKRRKRIEGDPTKNYATEWRAFRKSHGITQEELASVLNVTRRTILNVERRHHIPSRTSRAKMAELQKRYREAQA